MMIVQLTKLLGLKLPLVVPVAVAQRTTIAVVQRLTLLLKSNYSISNDSNLI